MKDRELSEALDIWFKKHIDDKNRYRSPVWASLKKYLDLMGNWRVLPRGNPKKGFRMMMINQNNSEEY